MSTELAVLTQEVSELRSMVVQDKTNRLNDSLFSKELAPHYMQLASQLSKSAMVPKAYQGKPQDLFVAMAMGYQIGLSVEQAVQAIAVINGKPCLWGDEMMALCMAHKDFEDIIEEPILANDAVIGYKCTVKRKGRTNTVNVFTLDDAKKAGLLGKQGAWTLYTSRMLKNRARGFSLRDSFPDALKGIKSREEIEDYIDAEYKVVEDKGSRTELLKRDYLTKKGNSNAEINFTATDLGSHLQNPIDSTTTDENAESYQVDEARKQEVEARAGDTEVHVITSGQIEIIQQLFDEKGFTEERIIKALAYYEVDHLLNLPTDLADHLIAQLHKL
jgi:hypothetical protein